jgi:hypothetical protein
MFRQFEVSDVGGQRYVVVNCPAGHQNCGLLATRQISRTFTTGLTCAKPACNRTWIAAVPFMHKLKAVHEA